MEMTFRQRYFELERKEWSGTLSSLVDWLKKRCYFEVYNDHYMKGMVDKRNYFAHPKTDSIATFGQLHLLFESLDMINGLYEDPQLRQKRIRLSKPLFTQIET